jgi:MSHA biogenesis protein MshO
MTMKARGFTLIELIVAITISAIVVIFASMFISAPLGAYETHSRRAALVADTSGAWPRMEGDLRLALPNSLRARRNGNFVVIEMLRVVDVARYTTPTTVNPVTTSGVFRGIPLPFDSNNPPVNYYLSVGNLGTAGADAYALANTMTPAGTRIQIAANVITGESSVTVTPAAAFTGVSLRQRLYLVSGPVTYLCDEGLGTLRRYANYTIAPNQIARDSPAELAAAVAAGGGSNELVTQGLTSCHFEPMGGNLSQTASLRLTTTRKGDSVTLLHTARAEYVP